MDQGCLPVALAFRVLLCLLLLREMAFAVCNHPSHVVNIFLVILLRILLRILLENLDDLASTILSLLMVTQAEVMV